VKKLTRTQRLFLVYYLPAETLVVLVMLLFSELIHNPGPFVTIVIASIIGSSIGMWRVQKRMNTLPNVHTYQKALPDASFEVRHDLSKLWLLTQKGFPLSAEEQVTALAHLEQVPRVLLEIEHIYTGEDNEL
jgi:hypothetical protein